MNNHNLLWSNIDNRKIERAEKRKIEKSKKIEMLTPVINQPLNQIDSQQERPMNLVEATPDPVRMSMMATAHFHLILLFQEEEEIESCCSRCMDSCLEGRILCIASCICVRDQCYDDDWCFALSTLILILKWGNISASKNLASKNLKISHVSIKPNMPVDYKTLPSVTPLTPSIMTVGANS